ncbi:BQ2448_6646 [Microbotryum intermedium]|uniref:BQ2448_6646 protein n=1 Tax=Microbotryum intermedium TaxID=269621 RepID=A0A238FQQ2_9BASI|nr:BQ2448_6646 [Microbotryum intermedium]
MLSESAKPLKIWESSAFLATKSDYFKDLFDSGFAETAKAVLNLERCKEATHLVQVSESSSDVYQAIFTWLRTGLVFAPLGEMPAEAEPESEIKSLRVNTVSAASIFLHAHYLQLSELVELTLVWVGNNLKPENVVFELSRDWTGKPTEMKDKLLAFAVANWAEVKKAKALTTRLEQYAEKQELSAALIEPMILGLKMD